MITLTLIAPALTAFLLVLIPKGEGHDRAVRYTALFGSVAALGFSCALLTRFDPEHPGFQPTLTESHDWISALDISISYRVSVDGISIFMVILTALLTPIAVLCSWRSISFRVREFHVALLLLETGMLGVFVATDFVLFYVFWEVTLIPMYLLIGIWGSKDRIRAAVKFFLYTVAGSFFMFLAMVYLYYHLSKHGVTSFALEDVYAGLREHPLDSGPQLWCFLAFALSFAIKVPLFPFHTWLPDAHTEAPTAGSVILAGVLLKMGTYGFVRFAIPFFPEAAGTLAPYLCVLSIVGIIFGAFMCLTQTDIKRLIAYSSVSHLGFITLGIFVYTERGLTGGLYQMINHGISTGALFLLVGAIYERRHTRHIEDYGGIAAVAPRLATLFFITTLSSIGLPFLNGFVGEFLILQGTFENDDQGLLYTVFAGTGVVLGAVYMLRLYRSVFLGKITDEENETMTDLDLRELGYMVPLVALMVILGLFSPWFTERMAPTVQYWFELTQLGTSG